MKPEQARDLIATTFTQSFDKDRFRFLAVNLLNHIDESKAQAWNSTYVKNAFKDHIQRYERLGTYTTPDGEKLDVLVVHLTASSKLERARAAIRNFVADHLKTRDEKDAALVAFVSPSEKQWRFSYVKMEYAAVEKDDGQVAVQTRLTPARRSSYLVGEGESCHTAQTRFLDLLQDTGHDPTLADIEAAFSVEVVTKEFFGQYKELYLDLKDALDKLLARDKILRADFTAKKISTADFAKKLMGQIVFLYFLQKKGWLGVPKGGDWGDGPRNFLRRLADKPHTAYDNFFNEVLEPLFYDTLATDRGHEAWCKTFHCRIPFLNGGLFEPLGDYDWKQTHILLPNRLFYNQEPVEGDITGTGILDVFDRYNFTVNEAEPLEKDVAIDPEMLGKVFENLLGVKERKSKGSFYTPREIVHYMCQESLIHYLDTSVNADKILVPRADIETFIHSGGQASHYESARMDGTASSFPKPIETNAKLLDEKLADIAICDPAVGSGAFPVGILQEIARARSSLTPYFNDCNDRTPYHFKRHAIQNCLYGVDIDLGAVEIAKLRLWLSLVVDEEDVKQVRPLPNLDYKIVAGNSLIGFPGRTSRLAEIAKLKQQFFNETDSRKKAQLKFSIDGLLQKSFEASKRTLGYEVNFDFHIYFSEIFESKQGFDVVIGNPPYVRQEEIKELKPMLKDKDQRYECFTGTADLLVYFYERGVKLLRPGGTLALITSNKYYRAGYGEKLREFLVRELTLHRLIDFGDAPVFEAIAYASILVGIKTPPAPDINVLGYTWEKEMAFERIAQVVPERGQQILQRELKPEGWSLESPAEFRLLKKLRRAGKPLGEYVNGRLYYGIKTGLNKAFVVDQATREQLVREHPSSAEILKPFLRGRDVKRWRTEFAEQYLIKIESSKNKDHPWSGKPENEAEKIFAATYPAIYARLEGFRTALLKREDQGKYFWELRSCIYWQEFDKPKIVFPDIAKNSEFAWDSKNHYLINTSYILLTTEKWMLGLLNSNLIFWFYTKTSNSIQGGFVRFIREYVETIPIPDASYEQQKAIEQWVERILSAKHRNASANVSALEAEIDALVYALYGLTDDEIKLVESSTVASSQKKSRHG